MRVPLLLLIAIYINPNAIYAEDPRNTQFVRGFIHDHYLIVHIPTNDFSVRVYATDLRDSSVAHILKLASKNVSIGYHENVVRNSAIEFERAVGPPSVSVDRGRLWLDVHQLNNGEFRLIPTESIQNLAANEIVKGNLEWIDPEKKKTRQAPFGGVFWWSQEDRIQRLKKVVGVDPRLEYFTLPIGDHTALRFELTFMTLQAKPPRSAQMSVYQLEGKYDEKKQKWPNATVKQLEEFTVDFREPFDSIVIGKAYLFITHSGKLYRSEQEPDPAKTRQTKLVEGLPGPIVALISDTNKPGEHYLVCRDGDGFSYKPLHKTGKALQVLKHPMKGSQLPYEPILEHVQTLIHEARVVLPVDKKP